MRTVFGDERLRESKQILRSLYVSCAALTSQDIPPPIEERVHRSGAKVYEIVLIPKAKMTNGHGT